MLPAFDAILGHKSAHSFATVFYFIFDGRFKQIQDSKAVGFYC